MGKHNNPSIHLARRQIVDLRFLGASWEDISEIVHRTPQYCKWIYYQPAQRLMRHDLRDRVAQSIADCKAQRVAQCIQPQHSPQVRVAYTRAIAAQTLALADRGPAQAALEAWMARVSGQAVDPSMCPLCGAARVDVMAAGEGDNGSIEGDNGSIEGQTGQLDRPPV